MLYGGKRFQRLSAKQGPSIANCDLSVNVNSFLRNTLRFFFTSVVLVGFTTLSLSARPGNVFIGNQQVQFDTESDSVSVIHFIRLVQTDRTRPSWKVRTLSWWTRAGPFTPFR